MMTLLTKSSGIVLHLCQGFQGYWIESAAGFLSGSFVDDCVDRLLDLPLNTDFNFNRALNVPAINLKETDNEYKLSIAAPGLGKGHFADSCNA
jgi:hypothetical protein